MKILQNRFMRGDVMGKRTLCIRKPISMPSFRFLLKKYTENSDVHVYLDATSRCSVHVHVRDGLTSKKDTEVTVSIILQISRYL